MLRRVLFLLTLPVILSFLRLSAAGAQQVIPETPEIGRAHV